MSHRTKVCALRKSSGIASLVFGGLTVLLAAMTPSLTETAVANGDTRTINLFYVHTQESISATYLVNGQYDRAVLQQLNWFLRDWRRDEPTNMDPRLFDVVWEAYRAAGAGGEVIKVVSAYRSPETNAMLRSRSRAVAKYSQHMLGKAMDTTMPGMPMSRIRELGMRMQRGGVGYYPTAGTPFVHLDVGNVRAWPRMTYEQLVQLFPDGKTVHLPSNGQPLPRYEEAKAEIEARNNGAIVMAPRKSAGGFLAFLFGGGEDEAEEVVAPAPSTRKQWAALAPRNSRAGRVAAGESDEEGGAEIPAERNRRGRSETLARAEANLPRGETVMTAGPEEAKAAAAAAKAEATAKAETAKAEAAAAKAEATAAKAEAATREKLARAPMPPARPASLEKPTPLDAAPADTHLAVLETQDGSRPSRAESPDSAKVEDEKVSFNAPLPPRRPGNLVARIDAPLPPTRPLEFDLVGRESANGAPESAPVSTAAVEAPLPQPRPKNLGASQNGQGDDALASLIDATGSTGASAKSRAAAPDGEPLAFAPPSRKATPQAAKPAAGKTTVGKTPPGSKAEFVPARLDRSNFRAMTAATPASRASGASAMGASIGAVRSAAHASEPSVLTTTGSAASAGFSEDVAAPATDKFGAAAE